MILDETDSNRNMHYTFSNTVKLSELVLDSTDDDGKQKKDFFGWLFESNYNRQIILQDYYVPKKQIQKYLKGIQVQE